LREDKKDMILNIENTNARYYTECMRTYNAEKQRSAYVITFGCQQNEADSEKIRAIAKNMGYSLAETPENADLVILNTCAIREHAEKKALSILGNFKASKKNNPDMVIGLCGCMAAEENVVEKIKKSFPFVSFTLEPNSLDKIPELVCTYFEKRKKSCTLRPDAGDIIEGIDPVRTSSFSAFVSVMYGCNNFCSYCIVPYVRGRERSRASADVIAECRELIARGYREITLLGQNVNSYKSDIDFPTLLSKIAMLDGDFIIRFMTSHPKDVSEELIRVFASYPEKIAPTFHLPLQSGSNRILKEMNRTYTREKYLETVEKLRAARPSVALTSDIIVAFPGESDSDFEDTMDIIKSVKFDMIYSFIYSPRTGTRAAKMENRVPREISVKRMKRLLDIQTEISHNANLAYIGTVEKVLIYEYENGLYTGRTLTNKLVHIKSDKDGLVGKFVFAKIEEAGAFYLTAKLENV
jgi:tRNA-2-methylthio-N6-dimethylallyladenosine synthase